MTSVVLTAYEPIVSILPVAAVIVALPPTEVSLSNVVIPVTRKVVSRVTASSTFNVPRTVVMELDLDIFKIPVVACKLVPTKSRSPDRETSTSVIVKVSVSVLTIVAPLPKVRLLPLMVIFPSVSISPVAAVTVALPPTDISESIVVTPVILNV